MKDVLDKCKIVYEKCIGIYDDYREVVPSYAPAALSFYLLLLLIPAFTLIAIGASLLKVDLSTVTLIIEEVVMPKYAAMIISVLESKSFNTVAVLTMIMSVYTVSRGIGNIYLISQNMYGLCKKESFVGYYMYTFKMTLILLLLFIGLLAILALKPLAYLFNKLYSLFFIRHILFYFMLVLFLMTIYKLLPKVKIFWEDSFYGALIASALMLLLYYGINIYFQYANFTSLYGPLGAIVMILFVFYWGAEIFYIGMYISYILHARREK